MNCRSCNYPLWNLTVRTCPECGAPFQPSEFEFVVNSIRFCCPTCRQVYYGTSPRGHLVPHVFNCVQCDSRITMDLCVLLPAEGVIEEETRQKLHPWFDRRVRWHISSWFSMMVGPLFFPKTTADSIPPAAPMGFLFGYLVLLGVWILLAGSVGAYIEFIFGLGAGGVFLIDSTLERMGWGLVISIVGAAAVLFGWIVGAHLVLRLTGRVEQGLERTGQALCYSMPSLIPCAVPCAGGAILMVVGPWWMISTGLALGRMHKVSGGRGVAAVILPPIVAVVVVVAAAIAIANA